MNKPTCHHGVVGYCHSCKDELSEAFFSKANPLIDKGLPASRVMKLVKTSKNAQKRKRKKRK